MTYLKAALFSFIAIVLTPQLHAIPLTTLYNTGVDASGTPRSNNETGDLHYTLVSVPGGTTDTRIRTSVGGFPVGNGLYLGDDTLSAWIGPNSEGYTLDGPEGEYVYRTTFDLTGLDPATALILGQWATDNDGVKIVLNGHDKGFPILYGDPDPVPYSFQHWTSFSLGSDFVAGLNTLDFIVHNLSGPTALRVEMAGTAVPDGGLTVALLGLTMGGMVWLRRKIS